jgi:hypothetical protein
MTGAASFNSANNSIDQGAGRLASTPNHFIDSAFKLPSACRPASAWSTAASELRIPLAHGDAGALDGADAGAGLDRQRRILQQVGHHQAVVEGGVDAAEGEVLQVFGSRRIAFDLDAGHRPGLLLEHAALPHTDLFPLQIGQGRVASRCRCGARSAAATE